MFHEIKIDILILQNHGNKSHGTFLNYKLYFRILAYNFTLRFLQIFVHKNLIL